MQDNMIIIIISVICFGALIGVFIKMKGGFGPINLKVYGLTLLIAVTALLVLSGISTDKLTPCFSILGAIAGYLFGLKNE